MITTSILLAIALLALLRHRLDAAGERALIARVASKDEQAFATLYDQYAGLLFSVVLSIVKKQEEAEEVLQEVFLQIWSKASTFDTSRENVYAWLTALARNRAIDRIRSRAYRDTQQEVAEALPDVSGSEETGTALDAMIMMEQAGRVRQALQEIPSEQRELIEMAYFEGYTQSPLAENRNLPLGTVKTRMRQGMKKLCVLLEGTV